MDMMDRRGLFFTVAVVLIVLPLLLFILYSTSTPQTKTHDTITKIRCDELHYFVEDVRADLERALVIFGRRAAIYAIDDVVTSGESLRDYTFNCTKECNVDCSLLEQPLNGSESALTELILCGTLRGENVTYMRNHSLSQWIDRIRLHGRDMHFNVSIGLRSLTVLMKDPWTVTAITNSSFNVYDESGTCYYVGDRVVTSSDTSIIGLEDPIFPIYTGGPIDKYIVNCSADLQVKNSAGCSGDIDDPGRGSATGYVVFDSNIADPSDYCLTTPVEVLNKQILVLDGGFGSCNQYNSHCFNISSPHHFAGILDYGPNSPGSFVKKCNVTIPWLRDTGDIDDEPPRSPPRRVEDCGIGDISDAGCILMENSDVCNLHRILIGINSNGINTTCYRVSNASRYGGFDGPSFMDRLDGSLANSAKYANQSKRYFNVSYIGLETLVNPYELDDHGVTVRANATWVDYLYWNGTYGCTVNGICPYDLFAMRLDDPHAGVFGVTTECKNATGCPGTAEVCVDQFDQDNDTSPDWLDYDCNIYFGGCGVIKSCDPTDSDYCGDCASHNPLPENSSTACEYYGMNTTEWHFYSVTPSSDGLLTIVFNGTGNVTGNDKTDIALYNYSINGGCGNPVTHWMNVENNFKATYCVLEAQKYVIGLDSDAPKYQNHGNYSFATYLAPMDASCPVVSTTSTTTTTTSTTTTTLPCGLFDDMETTGNNGWTTGGSYNEWEKGKPVGQGQINGQDPYSGNKIWKTDLNSEYENNANEYLTSPPVDLTGLGAMDDPSLSFMTVYDIEYANDHGYVEASADGGNWTALAAYDNAFPDISQSTWTKKTFDLSAYKGDNVQIRFRLASDGNIYKKGWYIDDFNVTCN
jgi:hypothetical protein